MQEVLACLSQWKIGESRILEIGCGTGWLSARLNEFGNVTAVDLAIEVIETAKKRMPEIDFRSGDIFEMELLASAFDIVVTLETLSHVHDQAKFMHRIAELLKPDGLLVLTTQNKYVFDRRSNVQPLSPGFNRKWVTMRTLKRLMSPEFFIIRATTLEPDGNLGLLRLVNSRRVNRLLAAVLGAHRLKRIKEHAGLGQTLFVVALKRKGGESAQPASDRE